MAYKFTTPTTGLRFSRIRIDGRGQTGRAQPAPPRHDQQLLCRGRPPFKFKFPAKSLARVVQVRLPEAPVRAAGVGLPEQVPQPAGHELRPAVGRLCPSAGNVRK